MAAGEESHTEARSLATEDTEEEKREMRKVVVRYLLSSFLILHFSFFIIDIIFSSGVAVF